MPDNPHRFAALVESELLAFLLETARFPLSHFSEKGLQLGLLARLTTHDELMTPVPTNVTQKYSSYFDNIREEEQSNGRDLSQCLDNSYRIRPLQLEYGRGGSRRIDLCVLDPADIQQISKELSFKTRDGQYVVPVIGVEFGTEKTGWNEMAKHLSKDAEKLDQCRHRYSISVMRSDNKGRRSLKGHKRKDETIDKFRRAIEEHARQFTRVKWIGLIFHLALGEVECFTSSGSWQRYDISNDVDSLADPLRGILDLA